MGVKTPTVTISVTGIILIIPIKKNTLEFNRTRARALKNHPPTTQAAEKEHQIQAITPFGIALDNPSHTR